LVFTSREFREYTSGLHQRTEELYRIPEGEPDEDGLIECPVIVLRDIVVFPHMVSPIFVTPGPNLLAIQEAQFNFQTTIALIQNDPDIEEPLPTDFLPIGVEMAVGRLLSMPEGNSSALVQGRRRVEVVEFTQIEPVYKVRVRPIEEDVEVNRQTDALMRHLARPF
jgi:ATP-dependent Lon protease